MCIYTMIEERWFFFQVLSVIFHRPLLHADFKLKVVRRWDNTSCQVRTDFSGVHFQFIREHSTQSLHFHPPPLPALPLVFGSSFASFFCPFEMLIQTVIPLLLTRFTSLFKTRRWSLRDIRRALLNACEKNLSSGIYEWHYSVFTGTYYSDKGATASAEIWCSMIS